MKTGIFLCAVIFSASTLASALVAQPRFPQVSQPRQPRNLSEIYKPQSAINIPNGNQPRVSEAPNGNQPRVSEAPNGNQPRVTDVPFSAWHAFKAEHKKQYADEAEEAMRRQLFFENLAEIEEHNADTSQTYTLGVNEFADLSKEELKTRLQSVRAEDFEAQPRMDPENIFTGNEEGLFQAASMDWRTRGAVTPVKNQGQCGGCWSFSATGALEGATAIKTGKLVSLSEQNLLDCSSSYGNMGCRGGTQPNAFNYVKANGGIQTGATYPFTGTQGTCRYNKANLGTTCSGYTAIASGNETALALAVANKGPVAVSIDATPSQFAYYKGGLFNVPTCSKSVTHAVLIVGYGTDNGTPYWLVKNSWGPSWGEAGYIRMIRNANNQCGIALWASVPSV